MMQKLISIIIPIYKVEAYLHECLDSVVNQSYTNLEIICVDDGSPDECGNIIKKYMANDQRIKLIEKENGGLSDARNAGLDICTGNYVFFLDSDDFLALNAIETLFHTAKEYTADIVIGNFVQFDDGSNPHKGHDFALPPFVTDGISAYEKAYGDYYLQLNIAWGKLYKASLFKILRYPVGRIHEDEFTTYKAIIAAKHVAYVNTPLLFYRVRPGSIMRQCFSTKSLDKIEAFKERALYFQTCGNSFIYRKAINMYLGSIIQCYFLVNDNTTKHILRKEFRKAFIKYKGLINIPKFVQSCLFLLSPWLYNNLLQLIRRIKAL